MRRSSPLVGQFWRYLGVGAVNTLFGYTLYAMLVALGTEMFLAQIVATVIAVAFNYFTYNRHVFGGASPSKLRFLLAYALNYLVGFVALALAAVFVRSPYLAGLLATFVAALINFVVLRRYVFVSRADRPSTDGMQATGRTIISEKIDHVSCR